MAYETGIATSPSNLLSILEAFAVGEGWTVNTPASGRVFINGDVRVGVGVANTTELNLKGCLGYSSGAAYDAQPNAAVPRVRVNLGAGPYTAYHLFSGTELGASYIHCVVEISTNIFRHLTFGSLVKNGTFTGGTYIGGVWWDTGGFNVSNNPWHSNHSVICDCDTSQSGGNTAANDHVWADFDSKANNWVPIANSLADTFGNGSMRAGGMSQHIPSLGYARWNLRNILIPLHYHVNRAGSQRSRIGRIPDMRGLGLHNLTPGEEFTVGSDTWKAFPIAARHATGQAAGVTSSGTLGYAYKKTV
jgi:hypothetical protein